MNITATKKRAGDFDECLRAIDGAGGLAAVVVSPAGDVRVFDELMPERTPFD